MKRRGTGTHAKYMQPGHIQDGRSTHQSRSHKNEGTGLPSLKKMFIMLLNPSVRPCKHFRRVSTKTTMSNTNWPLHPSATSKTFDGDVVRNCVTLYVSFVRTTTSKVNFRMVNVWCCRMTWRTVQMSCTGCLCNLLVATCSVDSTWGLGKSL